MIEAKDNKHSVRAGMQQALDYAERLDVPFVFSSNGDGFVLHDKTGTYPATEMNLTLDEFPKRADLWRRYKIWRGIEDDIEELVTSPNHSEIAGKTPRYYQQLAINRTIEAVAKGQKRALLVMATGTGKSAGTDGRPDPTRTDRRTCRQEADVDGARRGTSAPNRAASDARTSPSRPTTAGSDPTCPACPPFFSMPTENASTLARLLSSLLAPHLGCRDGGPRSRGTRRRAVRARSASAVRGGGARSPSR